jgi:hypothetical protein
MIRDAEIEQLMRDYTAPILRVAGLAQQNVQVVIIDDRGFNAFVMDAHRIFINTGALMEATSPNQLIGVFAHETGHIVGGHLSKMRQELANAQTAMIIAMLLGVGAMVAGAHSGNTDMGNVGGAVFTAPQAMAMNSILSYRRALFDHDRSIGQGHVRYLQAICRRVAVCGANRQSLRAEPSDAGGAHGGAGRDGQNTVLGQERSAGTAVPS